MFRQSKPLIGETPSHIKQRNVNEFEFTPIGQENHAARVSTIRKSDIFTNETAQRRNPLNNSPLANRINGGSSFIANSSFDNIHESANNPPKATAAASSSSPFLNQFQKNDLISNGSNPVIQQQENVSKLQQENYNLKVKIASLTRFLNSVTNNNQQAIYQQNSELQEKLIKLRSEMSLLHSEINQLRDSSKNSSGDNSKIQQYKDEIQRLHTSIKEFEKIEDDRDQLHEQLLSVRRQMEDLEEELDQKNSKLQNQSSPISKAYVQRIEEQVESLRDELEDKEHEIRKKDEELEAREDELEALESKLKQQKSQKSSEADRSNHLHNKLEELEAKLAEKVDKVTRYEKILETKNNQLKALKTGSENLSDKFKGYEKMIGKLEESYDKSKRQNDALKESLNDANRQNILLKDQIQTIKGKNDDKTLIAKLKQDQFELETEIGNLTSEIKRLNEVISRQQQTIESSKNDQISEEEVDRLLNDYESLQKKVEQLVSERDSLKKRLEAADIRYLELKDNSERTYRAYEKLKRDRTEKTTEYDDYQIKDEIKTLEAANRRLQQELEKEREFKTYNTNTFEKNELKQLISKCNDLQVELSEKEQILVRNQSKYQSELNDYRRSSIQKDTQIAELKKEIKSFQLSTNDKFEDEKFELLKSKSSKDKEIKMLQFQLNESKELYETELDYLKKVVEQLRVKNGRTEINLDLNSSKELIKKIEEKNSKIKILSERLINSTTDLKEFEKIITRLEQNKYDLETQNEKLIRKLYIYDEKLNESSKEMKNKNDDEVSLLQLKLQTKQKEINEANNEFNHMKRDLLMRYNNVLEDKQILQKKIDKLVVKYRQLQNNSNNANSTPKQISYLQNQSDYYRMKFIKGSYVINDLKFVNSFMVKSIQANNAHIKKDIKKLQNVGIYPDYELICNKKPSLSVYFKFVVAAIRMKRKTDHSSIRNKNIETLKDKLEVLDY